MSESVRHCVVSVRRCVCWVSWAVVVLMLCVAGWGGEERGGVHVGGGEGSVVRRAWCHLCIIDIRVLGVGVVKGVLRLSSWSERA